MIDMGNKGGKKSRAKHLDLDAVPQRSPSDDEHDEELTSSGIGSSSAQDEPIATSEEQETSLNSTLQHFTISADANSDDINYIEVRDTETKGQAVFATRKIKPGTLVLCETPLIRLTQAEEDAEKEQSTTSTETVSALDKHFNSLSRPQQKSYLKLFDSKKSAYSRTKSIYYSNCWNLSGSGKPSPSSPGGSAIGQQASRINHSCIPNVQFSFCEETNKMSFRAIKPIPCGREILANYDTSYELRSTRQRKQMLYYGFQCDCEACQGVTEFWSKSDERRKGIIEARREVRRCEEVFVQQQERQLGRISPANDPSYALERWEALMIKEGLLGLPFADLYRMRRKWAERKQDKKEVKKWLAKELDVCRTCLGADSFRVRNLLSKVDDDDATTR